MRRKKSASTPPTEAAQQLARLNRSPSLLEQVESVLRQAIAERRYADDRLPTEMELGEQLGVSRETVRRATEVLKREGLLVKYRRKGTFIAAQARALALPDVPPCLGYFQTRYDAGRANEEAVCRSTGELPAVVNPERKAQAEANFRFFCELYFPLTFHLPWSRDHLKVVGRIEQAVLRGGLFALTMPRGSGKSTICECACIWAVLYGHCEFVCLIGSDEGHAMDMLDSIKMELDGNDLLLENFPEVVYPIQCLDGIANRCNGQLYKGERAHIGWTAREIVLPAISSSNASGAFIKVAGITGRICGMKYKRADGKTVRPTLVVLDSRGSRVEQVEFAWERKIIIIVIYE